MMSHTRKRSPWAYDDSGVKCPHCGCNRISRIVDAWALKKGVQMFKCNACGKRFYEKGFDNYRPTY